MEKPQDAVGVVARDLFTSTERSHLITLLGDDWRDRTVKWLSDKQVGLVKQITNKTGTELSITSPNTFGSDVFGRLKELLQGKE